MATLTPRLSVSVTAPILISSGQAHAVLQDGRLVGAADQGAPYCEFEVRRVSGETAQSITQGEFQVDRIRPGFPHPGRVHLRWKQRGTTDR